MPPLIHIQSVFFRRLFLLLVSPLYFSLIFGIRMVKGVLGACAEFREMFVAVWRGFEEEAELLPCPFCGGDALPDGWRTQGGASGPSCDQCGATAWSAYTWNTRISISVKNGDLCESIDQSQISDKQ